MSGFMKKLMATGAALTIGFSSYASANTNPCCPAPACDPCASWCDNLSFDAAWLYWKTSGDELDYAVVKRTSTLSPTSHASHEKIHDIRGNWDSGFKIGFGFDVPCKGWNVYTAWTHYDSGSSHHLNVSGPSTGSTDVVSVGFPVLDRVTGTVAAGDEVDFEGKLNFRYNVVDVELGKWICCGNSCVMFRPHVGLRFADIHEKFTDEFSINGSTQIDGFTNGAFHHKNNFKGAGVRAGLDVDLCLCEGWSIIGKGAASSVWGRTHLRNHVVLADNTTSPDAWDSEVREDYRQVRFITDLSLGLRWKTMACGCYPFTVELSWEHHYLFGQHRYWVDDEASTSVATSSWKKNGDIALQGLTLDIGFDF